MDEESPLIPPSSLQAVKGIVTQSLRHSQPAQHGANNQQASKRHGGILVGGKLRLSEPLVAEEGKDHTGDTIEFSFDGGDVVTPGPRPLEGDEVQLNVIRNVASGRLSVQ